MITSPHPPISLLHWLVGIIPTDCEKAWPQLTKIGLDPTKRFDNRYLITAIIGKGDRGFVLLGEDLEANRAKWALKIISPELSKDENLHNRIFRSVALCRNLKHKNIVVIGDHAQTADGFWYYKMEFVDGRSLLSMLHSEQGAEFDFQQILFPSTRKFFAASGKP